MTTLYHKIQSLYLRDPETNHKRFLEGKWSMPEFEHLQHNAWEWTEKVDGTNVRVWCEGSGVCFGGRTYNAQLHTGLLNHLNKVFSLENLAYCFGHDHKKFTLFGEGFGEKIQGGLRYTKGQSFVLFDVFCDGMWLRREDVDDIADKLGVPSVPTMLEGTLHQAVEYVKSSPRSSWGDFPMEGIVMRPKVELMTRRGERVITKLKVKDFR